MNLSLAPSMVVFDLAMNLVGMGLTVHTSVFVMRAFDLVCGAFRTGILTSLFIIVVRTLEEITGLEHLLGQCARLDDVVSWWC